MQCILPTSKDVPASSLNKTALAQRAIDSLPHHGNNVYDATRDVVLKIQAEHDLSDDEAAMVYGEVMREALRLRKSQTPRRWVSRPPFPVEEATESTQPSLVLKSESPGQLMLF